LPYFAGLPQHQRISVTKAGANIDANLIFAKEF